MQARSLVFLFALVACGGAPDAKSPPGKGLHDDDWRDKIEAEPSSVKSVRVDGHRYLVRGRVVHLPFRIGHQDYTWPEFEKSVPSFMDLVDEATGKAVLAPAPRTIVAVDDYGIFSFEGTWEAGSSERPLARFDTKTGKLVASDVLVVGGADLSKRAYVTRILPDHRHVLDIVVAGKTVSQFEVPEKRTHNSDYSEAVDGFVIIHGKEADFLLDEKGAPVAAPASGMLVVRGEEYAQNRGYATPPIAKSDWLIARRAPGTSEAEDLWLVLDKNGWFGAPQGARALMRDPPFSDGHRQPVVSGGQRYWFIRYDVDGDHVKKWGIASGLFTHVSGPRWYDVRTASVDVALDGGQFICGQDDAGWQCFSLMPFNNIPTDISSDTDEHHHWRGTSMQDIFVKIAAANERNRANQAAWDAYKKKAEEDRIAQEAVDRAWQGQPSTSAGIEKAWAKAVSTKSREAIARIVWLKNDQTAWDTYLDGEKIDGLPIDTLATALLHVTGARREAVEKQLAVARAKQAEAAKREAEQERARLVQQARFKPSATDSAPGAAYVTPPSSTKTVGANAGPSEEQQLKNYGRMLDIKIYGSWRR